MKVVATYVAYLGVLMALASCSGGGGSTPYTTSTTVPAISKPSVYERRCPGRGLEALSLNRHARAAAAALTAQRVGRSAQIDVTIKPAVGHDPSVAYLCGSKIARRTIYVTTYDHRFDHGRNKSASLAQHRFLVGRFQDGYHIWYWEH